MPKLKPEGPRYRRYTSEQRRAMLIEAGKRCLAQGGILGFTIDNICQQANASRGLITHHFKSKEGLLVAIYAAMYDHSLAALDDVSAGPPGLAAIVDAEFRPEVFNRENITIWLALWGEIATNPALSAEHHQNYSRYRRKLAEVIGHTARARDRDVDPQALAIALIALIDGLWLEACIAPNLMSAKSARNACFAMLKPFLGSLP